MLGLSHLQDSSLGMRIDQPLQSWTLGWHYRDHPSPYVSIRLKLDPKVPPAHLDTEHTFNLWQIQLVSVSFQASFTQLNIPLNLIAPLCWNCNRKILACVTTFPGYIMNKQNTPGYYIKSSGRGNKDSIPCVNNCWLRRFPLYFGLILPASPTIQVSPSTT